MSLKGDALDAEMADELGALANYLAEYYGLPELPRVISDESS
jgi:hypothetical protein